MPLFKFGPNDIFYNQLETHPQCEFFIYDRTIYYNNRTPRHGVMEFDDAGLPTHFVKHVCPGYVSLYELNIDRPEQAHDVIVGKVDKATMIYPFITKSGTLTAFKTVSTVDFHSFAYGDTMTGSYPLASSISIERYVDKDDAFWDVCGKVRPHIRALKNTLNYHKKCSPHYAYVQEEIDGGECGPSQEGWDKETQELTLISIPSIIHGSGVERGTVDLRFYLTGSLVGQLQDINENGELIQTAPENSPGYGKVAGVVLYDEGFMILTGSWSLEDTHTERYRYCPEPINEPYQFDNPKWLYWGTQGYNEPDTCGESADPTWLDPTTAVVSSSFYMSFNSTTYIPTITMLAHAKKGELNHSNNPTYLTRQQKSVIMDSKGCPTGTFRKQLDAYVNAREYRESPKAEIKNTVRTPYPDPDGIFDKQTWISKVGIYDNNKNLIAIAKLASPVRKNKDREFTFKIKMDF